MQRTATAASSINFDFGVKIVVIAGDQQEMDLQIVDTPRLLGSFSKERWTQKISVFTKQTS